MVATVETVRDSGRPDRPANLGGAMMDYLKTTKYKVCPVAHKKKGKRGIKIKRIQRENPEETWGRASI